jgi:hypothetical protein
MDNLQAGVAFLGFARFEEMMAHAMEPGEEDAAHGASQPPLH